MQNIYFNEDKCMGCFSCVFACAVEHSLTKDPLRAHTEEEKPVPRRKVTYVDGISFTSSCNHCETPLCVESCITGSIKKDADGSVVCDIERCVGCWMCVMVCPFGAINTKKTYAVKCDLCPERENSYACTEACPTKALHVKL